MAARVLPFLISARTILLMLVATASAAAAVIASSALYDPDVWWVAAAGRETLTAQAVPRHNLFSFTEPLQPWIMHEWLLGPVYALGLARFGPAFFSWLTLFVFAAQLTVLLVAILRLWAPRDPDQGAVAGNRASDPGASAALLLALVALGFFGSRMLSARPSGVATIYPLALVLVAFAPRFSRASVIAATVIGLLWSNSHGSFPLGLVLLGVSAWETRTDRFERLVACAGFALGTLLTPYGLELHRLVFDYVTGGAGIYREIHQDVNEFHGLVGAWGVTTGPADVIGLCIVLAVAVVAVRRTPHRVRGFFCLLLVALATLQARHIELAGLLGCILLAPVARELALPLTAALRLPADDTFPGRARSAVFVVGSALAVGTLVLLLRLRADAPAHFLNQGQPLLDSLAAVKDRARLYAPFKESAIAIWYGFPRGVRVFYDPRNDCYSSGTFRAFAALSDAQTPRARMLDILDSTQTDAVLVEQTYALAPRLAREPAWALTFQAGPWRVFERRSPR